MMKAVKFIYDFTTKTPKTELKSLDRINWCGIRSATRTDPSRFGTTHRHHRVADKSLADMYRETKAASGMGIPATSCCNI
jgi:hypothetical protein